MVVGAGAAGCVLAARLSEDPACSVGLIEAGAAVTDPRVHEPGQWPFLQGSAVDWAFETTPQRGTAGRRHAWARGKALGGSTVLHALAHVRGHPADFDAWAADGCAGWGWLDLLPYFIKAETWVGPRSALRGTCGPIHLVQLDPHPLARAFMGAAEEAGFAPIPDHNGEEVRGPTANTLMIRDGRRLTAADAYLAPAARRPNLRVIERAVATELVFAPPRRCRGVLVEQDGALVSLSADQVVLAAGTVGTATLLLRSGIGPAAELADLGIDVRADLPGVGRNLRDHLLAAGNLYEASRPVPPSRWQHSESLLYADGGGVVDAEDGDAPALVLACVTMPVTTECFSAPPIGAAYTLMFGFTHPRSHGVLRLAGTDHRAPPIIDPDYLAEAHDRFRFAEACELARAIGHAPALGPWRSRELLPGPGDGADRTSFLERAACTHHHPVGTCRMGVGADSVVDPGTLGVHGFEALHVVDGSILPSLPTGPTNAAITAIAERASDLIRDRAILPPAP